MRKSNYYRALIIMIVLCAVLSTSAFIFKIIPVGIIFLVGTLLFLHIWHSIPFEDKYR